MSFRQGRLQAAAVLCVCALLSAVFSPTQAQIVPPSFAPGAIERGLEQQLPQQRPDRIELPAPRDLATPSNAAAIRFTLRGIDVQGATAVPPDALAATYNGLIGKDVTLADIYGVANAITALYVQYGYAISFAVVPAQEIDMNGRVRIEVVEGFVAEVNFPEGAKNVPPVMRAYVDSIKASRPLRTAVLERYLLLLNDIPGVTARSVFQPLAGGERGSTQLAVNLVYDLFSAEVAVDNRGSAALGPYRANLLMNFNNILGLGDSLRLRTVKTFSDELAYVAARWTAPVGGNGTIVSFDVTYSDASPGVPTLAAINFASSGWIAGVQVEHPLLRRRENSLSLIGGFTGKWLESKILATPNSRDNIYKLNGGLNFSQTDSTGITTADATLSQGLDLFNATRQTSPLRSRFFGDGVYTAVDVNLSRLQSLGGGFDLLAAGSAHFAWRGLLASEQCGYGGGAYGRGFDDNELVGDGCAMATAELRYTTGQIMPSFFSTLQLYTFADFGVAWKEGRLLPGEPRNVDAQSVGAGIRAQFIQDFAASLEFAAPLSHDVAQEGNRDGRVFFSVSKRF